MSFSEKLGQAAQLALVLEQTRIIFSTSGHNRFTKDKLLSIRKQIALLEDKFLESTFDLNLDGSRVTLPTEEISIIGVSVLDDYKAVGKAMENISQEGGAFVVNAPVEPAPAPAQLVLPGVLEPPARKPGRAKKTVASSTEALSTTSVAAVPVVTEAEEKITMSKDDLALKDRLAEEKKRLLEKGKRKSNA